MFERMRRKPSGEEAPSYPPHTVENGKAFVELDTASYPSVQDSMKNLNKIIEAHAEDSEVRHTPSGEPVVSGEIIDAWIEQEGYEHRKNGTYRNGDTYLYFKHCNLVKAEEDVDKVLATARQLTGLGAIHPESQWGVTEAEESGYLLFVVSPKLETWADEEVPEGQPPRTIDKMAFLLDLYQRIDSNFVPGQPIPEGSLLHHISWSEASQLDNWGWDKTGRPYPIDVEVIHPRDPGPNKNYEPWKPTPPPDEVSFYEF